MKRERKRMGSERLIVWFAVAAMTVGLAGMSFLIGTGVTSKAGRIPEGVLLQLQGPLETAEIEAAKEKGYETKHLGTSDGGGTFYEIRSGKEETVLVSKVSEFTRDVFTRPIEGEYLNLSAHKSIAMQMGTLAWLVAILPLSLMVIVVSIRKLGALQDKEWNQGLQGIAIIAIWLVGIYYLTGRLDIPREFLPEEQILDIGFYAATVKEFLAGDGWVNLSAYQTIRSCYKEGITVYGMWILCAWLGTIFIRVFAGIENRGTKKKMQEKKKPIETEENQV